ncbi:hypothetical protein PIB30_049496 [Stylosanthes scabra]|uniref:Uncharacterized protein n=1 Tax=Stylosanthes scabra TaxID=79078 RepID=A0ABU6SII1_9FABA|nr:hypothetical protein [Stylosanthes scabra]
MEYGAELVKCVEPETVPPAVEEKLEPKQQTEEQEEVHYSEESSDGWMLERLKSINLSFSKNLNQTPDFSEVPNLESLVLEGCTSLTIIHSSLMHLKKLVQLNLKDCKRLKALTGKMEISSLKYLDFSGCSELKTVPEFGGCMKHLSMLSFEGTAITKLPSSLGCLLGLAVLKLKNCKNLSKLEYLGLNGCKKLKLLPELPLNLKRLDASNCTSLVTSTFRPSRLPSRRPKTYEPPSIQLHIPTELKNLFKGLRFAATTFEMVIPGSDIPSWFAPQKFSSYAEKPFFTAFPPTEGVGYAMCFLLESSVKPSQMCRHKITCSIGRPTQSEDGFYFLRHHLDLPRLPLDEIQRSLKGKQFQNNDLQTQLEDVVSFLPSIFLEPRRRSLNGKQSKVGPLGHQNEKKVDPAIIITSRNLPLMQPNRRHLYILFVSIKEYTKRSRGADDGFQLKSSCGCGSLKILKCGCHLVCKSDVEDLYGTRNDTLFHFGCGY